MTAMKRSPRDLTIPELDRELLARGARLSHEELFPFPDGQEASEQEIFMAQLRDFHIGPHVPQTNDALSHLSTWDLTKALVRKIREEREKAIWGFDYRKDFYEISKPQVKQNAATVAAICMPDALEEPKQGTVNLKHRNFGKAFNLCSMEPFSDQRVSAGRICTGFLVAPDILATAAHCVDQRRLKSLRVFFGFRMEGARTPVTQIYLKDIYRTVEILHRVEDSMGSGADWALVKLDREVQHRPSVILSREPVVPGQDIYTIGHPCGLPLKYAPGAKVFDVEDSFFTASLSVYGGSSGSPVFCKETHRLVGIVVRGDVRDFRWTGKGLLSVSYPNAQYDTKKPQCTRVSQFSEYCNTNACTPGNKNRTMSIPESQEDR